MQIAGRDYSICAYLRPASATGPDILSRLLERRDSSRSLLHIGCNANDQHVGLCFGSLSPTFRSYR